jgi:hypothetical protein
MSNIRKLAHYLLLLGLLFFTTIILFHNVLTKVTNEDILALQKIYPHPPIDASQLSFEEQIAFIQGFQKELHQKINRGFPIDYNQSREPKDLLLHGTGLCYDFSRTIEKFLVFNQFEVRHVSIYQTDTTIGKLKSFIKPGALSHALTEVKTKNGWMIVDSNYEWIALDNSRKPYSFKEICKTYNAEKNIDWLIQLEPIYLPFYDQCPVFIYGLYSRHGGFYPPYTILPDYNLRDLLVENLFSGT